MVPALALHALLSGGHGAQPITKQNHMPPIMPRPGTDPRLAALVALLHAQHAPQMASANPAPPKAPPAQRKPIISVPTDNQGL